VRSHIVPIALLFSAACGNHGSGKINGTVHGESIEVNSASYAITVDTGVPQFLLALWSEADACDAMAKNNRIGGAQGLVVVMYNADPNGTSTQPGPGTYSVTDGTPQAAGSYAMAGFSVLDSACGQRLSDELGNAVSGQVVLSSVTPGKEGAAKGTFDLAVGSAGDHVTGSFDALSCDALLTFRATSTHGCQ
jgi:hypothetical protein